MVKKQKDTGNKFYVGTSGWGYGDWRGVIYPEGLKSKEYLPWYAIQFDCTEINYSFYHMPREQTIKNWVSMVPDDFKFCPKISKYITHIKRLKDVGEPLERFFSVFQFMEHKLGPVLIQLPASVKFNPGVASGFFKLLYKSYKKYLFAFEARDISWYSAESIDLMRKYNISSVISYSNGKFPLHEVITAKDVYVRFHGPEKLYGSLYTDEQLKQFAEFYSGVISEGHRVWAFFNNTMAGYGFHNAKKLNELLEKKMQA